MVNFAIPDFAPAWPEIFVLVMASLILIADLFISDPRKTATYLLSLATLIGAAALTWCGAGDASVTTFSGMFVDDMMADVLKLMVYASVFLLLVYSRAYLEPRDMMNGEFYVLALFATLGMM